MKTALMEAQEARNLAVEAFQAADAAIQNADSGSDLEGLQRSYDEALAEVERRDAQVKVEEKREEARNKFGRVDIPAKITVGNEPLTYRRSNPSVSYALDLARVQTGLGNPAEARERLARHAAEMKVEVEKRANAAEARSSKDLNEMLASLPENIARALEPHVFEKRDITRVDGSAGEFVPPLWVLDEYAAPARASRPFADQVRNVPLPAGTDSINVPRITTGTSVASQSADNAAVNETDIVSTSVAAPVRTIAGQQDVPLQLLDQSPIAFDELIFADLINAYNAEVDRQCINGSGASGEMLGILNTSGINAITWTDADPTVPELYPKLADGLSRISTNRFMPATHMWFAPRRWYWAASRLDEVNRPFFVSFSGGPNNAYGGYARAFDVNLPVSNALGVEVWMDHNIPTTVNTDQDPIILTKMDDHVLFEGDLRTRALSEVLSGTLQVRLQVYAYAAFTAGRYPKATSVITGTGMTTPVF